MSQNSAQRAGSADDVKILKRIHGVRGKASITPPRCYRPPHSEGCSIPYLIRSADDLRYREIFDVGEFASGRPAATVPAGMSSGLPVGMMLIGRHWEDGTVLRAADAFQVVG